MMLETVFALGVVLHFGEPQTNMGYYKTLASCENAAKAYVTAGCKPIDGTLRIYGTCWGCMNGCTAEQNKEICGVDPRPRQ
jgi:hypothetical protein